MRPADHGQITKRQKMKGDPVTDPRTDDKAFFELTTRRGSGWIIHQLVQLGCPQLVLLHLANHLMRDPRTTEAAKALDALIVTIDGVFHFDETLNWVLAARYDRTGIRGGLARGKAYRNPSAPKTLVAANKRVVSKSRMACERRGYGWRLGPRQWPHDARARPLPAAPRDLRRF